MKSAEHAAVGALVSVLITRGLDMHDGDDADDENETATEDSGEATARNREREPWMHPAVLWSCGVAVSVLIDLDHFLLARVAVGDWRHLRRVLTAPRLLFTGQKTIFEEGRFDIDIRDERLRSHVVLGTVGSLFLWRRRPDAAVMTAVCVSVHVLADVLRDRRLI